MFHSLHTCTRATALVVTFAWMAVAPSSAVILASPDGTENTSLTSVAGWNHVGQVNGASGTYLGNGWVITADHVGPGDFTLDGVTYPFLPGSEQSFDNGGGSSVPDLLMFQIGPYPALPPLALRQTPPVLNEFILMVGAGSDRGAATTFVPGGGQPLDGWFWAGTKTKRWGSNEIDSFPPGLVLGTVSMATIFDDDEGPFESQGSDGDSGGAVFKIIGGEELVGIMYAIGPVPGQPLDATLYTNATFSARIDFYYDQIQDVLALPEPSGALPVGAALVVVLARRRRRS